MKLLVNEKNEIEAYSTLGDIEGAIDFTETVPDDFYEKFKPSFYLLQNNEVIENSNYVAPTDTLPDSVPSSIQKIIMQQALTIVQMQTVMMQQSKDIDELKGGQV